MRFSIRDLLWATLVVAMGLGWWMRYRDVNAKRLEAVWQAHRLHGALLDAAKEIEYTTGKGGHPRPRWDILHEPLVEP
jgi:hypothetical protein